MEQPVRSFDQLGWRSTLTLLVVLSLLPVIALIAAMSLHWEATFSVNAQTEVVEFDTSQHNVPNWFVTVDRIRIDGADAAPFSGQIEIGRDTRVRLVRLQTGALRLVLERQGQDPVATLYDRADNRIAIAREQLQALVALPADQAITLPLAGRAIIGDTIFSQSVETSPVLLEGHVQVFGLYAIGQNRFAAQQAALAPGDRLEIKYSKADSGGHGMLRIEPEQAGIRVVVHADGRSARIIRFGTAGYELSPSLWARVSGDPLYQSLLAIYAVLLPAIGLGFVSLLNQWRLRQMARQSWPLEAASADADAYPDNSTASGPKNRRSGDLHSRTEPEPSQPSTLGSDDENA